MVLRNRPRILHGAFVEFGLSVPPLFVVFQFNPVELSRTRNVSFGEERPVCNERSTTCWDRNRRAHFVVTSK